MQLFAIEAEMAVLGAIMLGDRGAISRAADILKPVDFFRDTHQTIYRAMLTLDERGVPVDVVTLKAELERQGELEKVGGLTHLMGLAEIPFTTSTLEHYCRIVENHAVCRRLVEAADEIKRMVKDDNLPAGEMRDQAERRVLSVQSTTSSRPYHTTASVVGKVFETITHAYERRMLHEEAPLTGLDTGLPEVNSMTGGLRDGDLLILAARPSMGKTSAAFQIGYHVARPDTAQVSALFSLEMAKEEVVHRQLCAMAEVNSFHAQKGLLSDDQWARIGDAAALLYDYRAQIVDTQGLTPLDIRSHCRRIKAEQGRLDLVVVDYLGLISGGQQKGWNRNEEVNYIGRSLKELARELSCPVIALSQLSRSLERREDKRPMLSDMRDSGTLEEHADVVMFLYRPAYYERKKAEDEESAQRTLYAQAEEAELIIAKQRKGPTGTILLDFVPSLTTFAPVGTYRRVEN
jgi:replicative DNA helicase